jgi:hypothetical protein
MLAVHTFKCIIWLHIRTEFRYLKGLYVQTTRSRVICVIRVRCWNLYRCRRLQLLYSCEIVHLYLSRLSFEICSNRFSWDLWLAFSQQMYQEIYVIKAKYTILSISRGIIRCALYYCAVGYTFLVSF